MADSREPYRYTPYFCEENIWWLAWEMRERGDDLARAFVCLFGNRTDSIAVLNQRAAAAGSVMAWDYHVVLAVPESPGYQVFDFDSRLPFPVSWTDYFAGTFPDQRRLPERWRSRVRQIPAMGYLERFCSDRSHMIGKIPPSEFPDYPPICPDDASLSITLAAYRDLSRPLDDGSITADVGAVFSGPIQSH